MEEESHWEKRIIARCFYFSTSKILCSCFSLFRQRHFEFGISWLQLKMTSLRSKPSWLNWDKWPLHFVRKHKGCALTKQNRVPMAISLIVCKIHKAYLNKFFFLLWWKLEALFPNILHQTIYNLCKICEFENTFSTITHVTNTVKYLHSISLRCSILLFHFLTQIWISIAVAQYLAYLKYQWTWVAKQTLFYNETVKI